ncbi:MAG TPA: hypothetical protein VG873_17620 [Burkholderiales bacterium]|nr:hypothetical protein [Burkholderiales bacterium]
MALAVLLALPAAGFAQGKAETREMVGQIGSRTALLVLHATERPDGGWHMTGEYLLLPTFTRRFLEGERSPQLGVTTLKEGTSAILFGRPATGELRGRLHEGSFRGTRYGPGGQERERFEFSEEFPAMDAYSATVRCEAGDGRYASTLQFAVEGGRLKAPLEWSSRTGSEGHSCRVRGEQAEVFKGGLRVTSGRCAVTLRDLGDFVKVAAEDCAELCGSGAYLEPLLVDRRGSCRLLRPEAR